MCCASPSFCTFSSPLKNLPRWKGHYCLLKVSYVLLLAFAIFTGCCEFGRLWFKCVPTHTQVFVCEHLVSCWWRYLGKLLNLYEVGQIVWIQDIRGTLRATAPPTFSLCFWSVTTMWLQAPTSMSSLLCWAVPSGTVSLINLFSLKLPLSGILPHN